ncbi:MAG: hypothetical protein LC109_08335 [Bacteroidia bacterium]|jgi:hypothetical protein|nr:hypothetical protein [Bacteroidia bacterium]
MKNMEYIKRSPNNKFYEKWVSQSLPFWENRNLNITDKVSNNANNED